jgi:membrane protein YdbS with pleckstrin-like domain
MPEKRYPYNRSAFMVNFLIMTIVVAFINVFLDVIVGADLLAALVVGLISILVILVLNLSPLLTTHSIEDGTLVLRQGWVFRARIPMTDIAKVESVARGPLRTGVFFDIMGKSLYVTAQRGNLILITLKEPKRFGYALAKKASKIYFDTTDPYPLIREVAGQIAATPASPDLPS